MQVVLEFSRGASLASAVVGLATWSWCSHVDFVLEDGQLLGARPDGGVSLRQSRPQLRCERYAVDASCKVLRLAETQLNRPYDWPGVLGVGLHRDWAETDSWFCSELVAWAFYTAGEPLLRSYELNRITPRDLLLSPHLQPIPPAA